MSDYSSPSPEDEVADTEKPVDSGTPFEGTEDEKHDDDTVSAGTGTDEDTVSGGAPEPPD